MEFRPFTAQAWQVGAHPWKVDGGSALAITAQSRQQTAAYKFIEYLTLGKGAVTMADTGTFPSLKSILEDPPFVDPDTESNRKVNAFFGGQNVNEVFVEAAQRPVKAFQYLPCNAFAQSKFGDDISPAYAKDKTLEEGFRDYGHAVDPGSRQSRSPSSPVFRRFALELCRRLAERYADNPTATAWHVGNEYGWNNRHDYSDDALLEIRSRVIARATMRG